MEGLLVLVAGKIGLALLEETSKAVSSFLGSQVSLLTDIHGPMNRIKSELDHMEAFLDGVDTRRYNKTVEPWLKRVRKIAQEAEDVIDEYTYLVTGAQSQHGFGSSIFRAIKRTPDVKAWLHIAARLKEIERDLAHASTLKDRYDIKKLDSGKGISLNYVAHREANPSSSSYEVAEDQAVGMIEERRTLIKWLTDEVPKSFIITVWGMGGLGKTSLVSYAYKSREIKKHFDHNVWVSVSQSYHDKDLLGRILRGLVRKDKVHDFEHVDAASMTHEVHDFEHVDAASMMEKIRDILQDNRRYLVVLDDVWNPDVFFSLRNALPDAKLGSRIVITSRIHDVASLADEQRQMKLRTLNEYEAWDLFCKRAFWKEDDRRCPVKEIEEWGRKIVDKCDGLPLAIVAIARVMSLRSQTEKEWEHVYNRMSWEFTNNPALDSVRQILNLSYDDLPGYLKNCCLHCSIFPEDCEISTRRLIRLWVAEGFIQTRGTQTMEDVAEDYIDELIHRCMLQVVSRDNTGMVVSCRMHDLVRELTLTVATKENFSMAVTASQSARSDNDAQRLSVHDGPIDSVDLSRIRSLIVFGDVESPTRVQLSKARYLRVLDLQGAKLIRLPGAVGDLFNLHYLSLRDTNISRLPNSVGKLRNLQTLDLYLTDLWSLPKGTTKLKNLRHLTSSYQLLHAPRGLWNLTCLQTLQIAADEELVRRLRNLTQMRDLDIYGVRGSYCQYLISSLTTMTFLRYLTIRAYNHEELFQLKEPGHVPNNLMRLDLRFRLNVAEFPLLVASLGDKLRGLSLERSGLRDDPLPKLSCLSNLTRLGLDRAYDGERLCFDTGWFPKLKILILFDLPNLSEIKLETGSLGSLRELCLGVLSNLKQVPQGIEFQESIEFLSVWDCNPLLGQTMKGEQKCIVNHIPTIWNSYRRDDGEWVNEVIG